MAARSTKSSGSSSEARVVIRAVLFDWGGTLIRDDALAFGAPSAAVARHLEARFGGAITEDRFENTFQAVLPEYRPGETVTSPAITTLITEALARLECEISAGAIAECASIFFDCCTADQDLFDDARALLASLRYRGYRTGIVTNTIFPSSLLRRQMQGLGVAGYLDAVVASADEGLAKPHPAPFLRALQDLGVDPAEALFVGDSIATDVAGAAAAGMCPVLLRRGGSAQPGGYAMVHRLSALNAVLGEGPAG